MIKHIRFKQRERSRYKPIVLNRRAIDSRYRSHHIHQLEAAEHLHAYFRSLRAALDREQHPVLIVDLSTTQILSVNLFAFERLCINATGLRITDFLTDEATYQHIEHQLRRDSRCHQRVEFHDADGNWIETWIEVEVAPHCSTWAIVHLKGNP